MLVVGFLTARGTPDF